MLITGDHGGLTRDLLMTLTWAINMAIAELIIQSASAARSAQTGTPPPPKD